MIYPLNMVTSIFVNVYQRVNYWVNRSAQVVEFVDRSAMDDSRVFFPPFQNTKPYGKRYQQVDVCLYVCFIVNLHMNV